MVQQPPGGYPPAQQPRITPPAWWFAVGALLIVVGVVGAIALAVSSFTGMSDKIDGFQRVAIPGSGTVQLESGSYTVYIEGPDGATGSVLITAPDGSEVTLEPYSSKVTYSFGGHDGEAEFSFQATQSGTYDVTTEGPSGSNIAIGEGLGGGIVGSVLGALALGLGGLFLGIIVLIVTAVKRSGSKKRAAAGSGWGGGAPPPGQQWPAQPGPGQQWPAQPGPQQGPGPYGPGPKEF
ncbi:hypothetical protein JK358_15790 [Nocardia sp. 2]|uniref:Uncharacterized protein n=1 Tax=Nocardia acididurans TaxID=2802282 RepID=A0ABS1M5C6_9NOCA|nr:hypothetical protein [Nocardia acididurans]MBL1075858.1 hypothetical protein [Nocardia acididurans]